MSRSEPDGKSRVVGARAKDLRHQLGRKKTAGLKVGSARPSSLLGRLAGEVWTAMVHAVFARKERMAAVAAKFDLTLPQAQLLRLLQFGPARTMTSIADALACDASNVTGIVDRLETRGLIARGTAKHDRRITTITLTKYGQDVLADFTAGFLEPPAELRRLPDQQLRRLHNLIVRVFPHSRDETDCPEATAPSNGSKPAGNVRS